MPHQRRPYPLRTAAWNQSAIDNGSEVVCRSEILPGLDLRVFNTLQRSCGSPFWRTLRTALSCGQPGPGARPKARQSPNAILMIGASYGRNRRTAWAPPVSIWTRCASSWLQRRVCPRVGCGFRLRTCNGRLPGRCARAMFPGDRPASGFPRRASIRISRAPRADSIGRSEC